MKIPKKPKLTPGNWHWFDGDDQILVAHTKPGPGQTVLVANERGRLVGEDNLYLDTDHPDMLMIAASKDLYKALVALKRVAPTTAEVEEVIDSLVKPALKKARRG